MVVSGLGMNECGNGAGLLGAAGASALISKPGTGLGAVMAVNISHDPRFERLNTRASRPGLQRLAKGGYQGSVGIPEHPNTRKTAISSGGMGRPIGECGSFGSALGTRVPGELVVSGSGG